MDMEKTEVENTGEAGDRIFIVRLVDGRRDRVRGDLAVEENGALIIRTRSMTSGAALSMYYRNVCVVAAGQWAACVDEANLQEKLPQ